MQATRREMFLNIGCLVVDRERVEVNYHRERGYTQSTMEKTYKLHGSLKLSHGLGHN